MYIYFLDTNILLQCKDLRELPWREITDADEIKLVISRPVQEEIDRLKHDGNGRRAKRARKVNSLLREFLKSGNKPIIVHEDSPHVELIIAPRERLDLKLPDILDLSRSDDRIIAQALMYSQKNPIHAVALLTNDTNPVLTAKECGLSVELVPDSWLLPPEPDVRAKRIIALEEKLSRIEDSCPNVAITLRDKTDEDLSTMIIKADYYPKLSDSQMSELMRVITERFPEVKFNDLPEQQDPPLPEALRFTQLMGPMLGGSYRYVRPSIDNIQKYSREDYPKWLHDVELFFGNIHYNFESNTRYMYLSILLTNNGSVPAESVILEFKLENGFFFSQVPKGKTNRKKPKDLIIPAPPQAPKGKWVRESHFEEILQSVSQFSNLACLTSPNLSANFATKYSPPKDKYKFYHKPKGLPIAPKIRVYECEEFRHRVKVEIIELVLSCPEDKSINAGILKCLLTAKNLPIPYTKNIPISIEYQRMDTLASAMQCIKA